MENYQNLFSLDNKTALITGGTCLLYTSDAADD